MHRKIRRSENSQTVSLPEDMLAALELQEGSDVDVVVDQQNHLSSYEGLLTSLQQKQILSSPVRSATSSRNTVLHLKN